MASLPGISSAGPPLAIDDPGILNPGQWEVIVAVDRAEFAGAAAYDLPVLDVSLGLTQNTQISAALSRAVVAVEEAPRRSGLGYASVGYKWRWYADDVSEWAIAVNYDFPASHQVFRRDTPDDLKVLSLPVLYARSLDDWTVLGQIAWVLGNDGSRAWDYGLALTHPLGPRAEWMVELFGTADSSFGQETLNYHLGIDYAFSEDLHGLASVGSRISTDTPLADRLNFRYYVGLQWFFETR